jgi:hypothetical protein
MGATIPLVADKEGSRKSVSSINVFSETQGRTRLPYAIRSPPWKSAYLSTTTSTAPATMNSTKIESPCPC